MQSQRKIVENHEDQVIRYQGDARFGDLRIEVGIELGTFELALSELIQLTPGSVIEYEFDLGNKFALHVAGECVAYARLVQSDSRTFLHIDSVVD